MTVQQLVNDIATLPFPDEGERRLYEEHVYDFIDDVNRVLLKHPKLEQLLGSNTAEVLRSNHRNHALFMAELFRSGTLADLPATAIWAYRAYQSMGVHADYWTVHLPEWLTSFESRGLSVALSNISGVYQWLIDHHDDLLSLSQLPAVGPSISSEEVRTFSDALLALDLKACLKVVDGLVDEGTPITTIMSELIDPGLQIVGVNWENGKITVAYEHRATTICSRIIGSLLAQTDLPAITSRSVLVTAAQSEYHNLGALILATYFESAEWQVTFLGANTPNRDLLDMLTRISPDLMAISVTIPQSLPAVRSLLNEIQRTQPTPILVGGQVFKRMPSLRANIAADLVTSDPLEALHWASSHERH